MGSGGLGRKQNITNLLYGCIRYMCGKGGMGWVGEKSHPPSKIYDICCMCYIGCICNICGKGGKGVGDGGLDTNPTHHQNCIIFAVFVILVEFATCVGTHRKCIAAYKKYVKKV